MYGDASAPDPATHCQFAGLLACRRDQGVPEPLLADAPVGEQVLDEQARVTMRTRLCIQRCARARACRHPRAGCRCGRAASLHRLRVVAPSHGVELGRWFAWRVGLVKSSAAELAPPSSAGTGGVCARRRGRRRPRAAPRCGSARAPRTAGAGSAGWSPRCRARRAVVERRPRRGTRRAGRGAGSPASRLAQAGRPVGAFGSSSHCASESERRRPSRPTRGWDRQRGRTSRCRHARQNGVTPGTARPGGRDGPRLVHHRSRNSSPRRRRL